MTSDDDYTDDDYSDDDHLKNDSGVAGVEIAAMCDAYRALVILDKPARRRAVTWLSGALESAP
ncbi:hypothetical protein [Nocardia wallacei]|uniref:hypothetical protein n=1 Tax=Nocardia wallacei TaxID=480035 RepID=UPI0024590BC5|nr:hypothetical protein [Nocardia wallacei]